jgi:fumarylacetoacetate (FAA) hydrolase
MRQVRFHTSRAHAILSGIVLGDPPDRVRSERTGHEFGLANVTLLAPVQPPTFRDFYAFEAHVRNARKRRGLEMVPQWYEAPVFYYSNPNTLYGHDAGVPRPAYTQELDYELELACVLGKPGHDIPAEHANDHIAGYAILNDWSARDVQRLEMAVGLGPAKAKDFATSLGPWLVTPDELAEKAVGSGAELRYDLTMIARVNGTELSRGNAKDMHFTFAQMIARASQATELRAGDLIGSGTVGTGCLLELGVQETLGHWLQSGDVVELEVERLGVLRNRIV